MALTNTAKIPAASLKTDCSNTKYAAKPIQLHQNTPALVPFNDYLLSFFASRSGAASAVRSGLTGPQPGPRQLQYAPDERSSLSPPHW